MMIDEHFRIAKVQHVIKFCVRKFQIFFLVWRLTNSKIDVMSRQKKNIFYVKINIVTYIRVCENKRKEIIIWEWGL